MQRKRHDGPGVWHHVANRGIARRSVFDGPLDDWHFLSRIARVHRRGLLEESAGQTPETGLLADLLGNGSAAWCVRLACPRVERGTLRQMKTNEEYLLIATQALSMAVSGIRWPSARVSGKL